VKPFLVLRWYVIKAVIIVGVSFLVDSFFPWHDCCATQAKQVPAKSWAGIAPIFQGQLTQSLAALVAMGFEEGPSNLALFQCN
jgi:hypothetical protein